VNESVGVEQSNHEHRGYERLLGGVLQVLKHLSSSVGQRKFDEDGQGKQY
jgi:hypothetical protein